jgi:hypothetical protein
MEPNRFGRKLGIGVRVASRMARERAAQAAGKSASASSQVPPPRPAATPRPATKNLTEPARRVGDGTRRFGKAVATPLLHISGTLWLEITGLFFALFAIFFAQNAWKARAGLHAGPDHARFLLFIIVTAVFLYFSVSSFIKASRRGKRTTS